MLRNQALCPGYTYLIINQEMDGLNVEACLQSVEKECAFGHSKVARGEVAAAKPEEPVSSGSRKNDRDGQMLWC